MAAVTKPAFGTIESLAAILRPKYDKVDYIPIEGLIQGLLDSSCSAEEKVAYIRNALTAAELVREELAQR
jgi:hypothetical protein